MVQCLSLVNHLVQNRVVDPYPRTWAEIDLAALALNLAVVRGLAGGGVDVCLVCKADAYGHGLVPVGRFAARHGADWLGVATVQEGVALREAGVEARIMVMSPILAVEVDQAVFYGLDVFVESVEMGQLFGEAGVRTGRDTRLHLKVDTGLHRFGVAVESAVETGFALKGIDGVDLVGIAHHFVDSAGDVERTLGQAEEFRLLVEEFADRGVGFEYVHQANSAGVLREKFGNLVRVGIFAYGVDPLGLTDGGLNPVMTWRARVTSLRRVSAGETVSYSSTFRLGRDSVIATLGVGYGDGYARRLSSRGHVWLGGRRCPVVGLVCMDQMLVDVSDAEGVEVGDVAELLGKNLLVTELARDAETNSHELLTRVMSRVSRRYLYP